MPAMPLMTAIATYGHTRALKDGTIQSERVVLEHIDVSPITSAFRRMVRTLAFDVSEMAFSTYLCARVYHKPITALPVFLLRRFEHGAMVYNVKSGIQAPLDLHGRRVGVRSYTLTPGVWIRGILQSAYGVNPQQVQWVLFGDEHVAEYVAPSNVTSAPAGSDMVAMLLAGEIDAAIGVSGVDAPEIRPLIQSHRAPRSLTSSTRGSIRLATWSWSRTSYCTRTHGSPRSYGPSAQLPGTTTLGACATAHRRPRRTRPCRQCDVSLGMIHCSMVLPLIAQPSRLSSASM